MLDKSKETKFKKGNQYAWKKGQSGNPSGRPKVRRISDALRDKLPLDGGTGRSQAEGIAENLIRLAQGTGTTAIAAAKEVADRTEGKALQRSALDHRIDRDLLMAAMRIMNSRVLAKNLGIAESELSRGPHWTPLDGQLQREADSRAVSAEERRKFIVTLEKLLENVKADDEEFRKNTENL